MLAMFGIGAIELLILLVMGGLCVGVPVIAIVVLVVLPGKRDSGDDSK